MSRFYVLSEGCVLDDFESYDDAAQYREGLNGEATNAEIVSVVQEREKENPYGVLMVRLTTGFTPVGCKALPDHQDGATVDLSFVVVESVAACVLEAWRALARPTLVLANFIAKPESGCSGPPRPSAP